MDGVHDMGGMHGFGPVQREADEPVFHAPWEGVVYAMNAIGPRWFDNINASRHALEVLPPAEYLGSTYYERWLRRLELRLVELGLATQDELNARIKRLAANPDEPRPERSDPHIMERAHRRFARARRLHQPDGAPPRFSVGDRVLTRNIHPAGHTRLPRYARGKVGVIAIVHGSHDFPDTDAHGLGAQPQGIYSVRFTAQELWGPDAEGEIGRAHV